MSTSVIGAYGTWAAGLVGTRPPRLSLRRKGSASSLAAWRRRALGRMMELLAPPAMPRIPKVRVVERGEYDGVAWEKLSWRLPWGPPTEAVLLKPAGARPGTVLPGILGLHDHAGRKYFGWRKIAQISPQIHPHMVAHRASDYGGLAWANQAAKRGFAVLVHDTFPFGSRRVRLDEVSPYVAKGLREPADDDLASIDAYNHWAGEHESIMAKSLFCAGTTWPGVYLREDQVALSILAARPEVDDSRLVCAGLSGGGMRTVFLAGLDPRIRCCACVGFMTTWRDFALNVSPRHTWMTYVPLAANELDFPEILGLRVPRPVLVQSTRQDPLYTLAGMRAAGRILRDVYRTAGVPERCRVSFYDGGHKFDGPMQAEAFAWFERWLGEPASR